MFAIQGSAKKASIVAIYEFSNEDGSQFERLSWINGKLVRENQDGQSPITVRESLSWYSEQNAAERDGVFDGHTGDYDGRIAWMTAVEGMIDLAEQKL